MINNEERSDLSGTHSMYTHKCISGGAILVGGLIGMGLSFLLNMFSAGIGLTAFTTSSSGQMVLAMGGLLGALVGSIAIMFTTGWAAGYLAARKNVLKPALGALYGFAAWSVALFLSAFLVAHGSQLMMTQSFMGQQQTAAVISKVGTETMQTVAEKTNLNPPASTEAVQRDTELAAHNLGLSMLIGFLVFFVGALSSCIGGYCGIRRQNKHWKGV